MTESAALSPPAPGILAAAVALAVVMPLIGFMVGVVWMASGGARSSAGGTVLIASAAGFAGLLALLGAGGY